MGACLFAYNQSEQECKQQQHRKPVTEKEFLSGSRPLGGGAGLEVGCIHPSPALLSDLGGLWPEAPWMALTKGPFST